MSRSTASPRLERGVPSKRAARAKSTKTSDKPCARGRRPRAYREHLRPTAARNQPALKPSGGALRC
jgi:hypothetical protein